MRAASGASHVARETAEKYDINVPWLILMDPTSARNMRCTGCWRRSTKLDVDEREAHGIAVGLSLSKIKDKL